MQTGIKSSMIMAVVIILSYVIPLFLPWTYPVSMLGLAAVLLVFLLWYHLRRFLIYRAMQKQTDIDLSRFMQVHLTFAERQKYIVSEEELMAYPASGNLRNILNDNQKIFLQISPDSANVFFHCSGKIFILTLWLILTLVFRVFFR